MRIASQASATPRMHAPGGMALAGEAVGVAPPVPALVVVAHPRHLLGQQHAAHDARAEHRVVLDLRVLLVP